MCPISSVKDQSDPLTSRPTPPLLGRTAGAAPGWSSMDWHGPPSGSPEIFVSAAPPKRPNRVTEWDRATPPAEPDHSRGHPRGRRNLPWPISDSRQRSLASAAQLTCPVGLPGRRYSAVPIAAGRGTRTARLRPRHSPRQRLPRGGGARQRSGPRGQAPQPTRADHPHAHRSPAPPFRRRLLSRNRLSIDRSRWVANGSRLPAPCARPLLFRRRYRGVAIHRPPRPVR